jgi:hypothetical protein
MILFRGCSMDYQYLMDSDEAQDEILQRLYNLQTLFFVKKELGDLADITDRLFGYSVYCEQGNSTFLMSTVSVIMALSESLEDKITEFCDSIENWREEGYPEVDYEEIYALFIPVPYPHIQESLNLLSQEDGYFMEEETLVIKDFYCPESKEGLMRVTVKDDGLLFYADLSYFPNDYCYNSIINTCIKLRKIFEGIYHPEEGEKCK